VLEVEDLVVRYGSGRLVGRQAPAVDGVSFTVTAGETVGIVGESGAGKSTIGKAILGLQAPSAGRIRFCGRDITRASARERRSIAAELRAVFQDPYSSLNPRLTIGETLSEPLRLRHVAKSEARERAVASLSRVGLPVDAVDRYPRQFSGGQRQRIAIARALVTEPRIVVCDEPVSSLDLSTQASVLNVLADLRDGEGLAYVFIAHDLAVVEFLASTVMVLYCGQVMEQGATEAVVRSPRHPYTIALTAASPVPRPAEQAERRAAREAMGVGAAGSAAPQHGGCPFAPRCVRVTEVCRTTRPVLRPVGASMVACHHAEP
jgi:peptide/nickel transport system ATP-binding protein